MTKRKLDFLLFQSTIVACSMTVINASDGALR